MNRCGAACAAPADQAEQQRQRAAAPAGSSSSSGASPSWPPPTASTSFFRQLFADENDSAVAGAAVSSSYAVDDILLPPAATAFDDDNSADPVFRDLGAFPMVDSFVNTRPTLGLTSDLTSDRPHTLEFVTPPSYTNTASPADTPASALECHYQPNPACQLHTTDGDDQVTTSAKKAKLRPVDQHCSSSDAGGVSAVDPTQLQSLLSKVNQSQAARSKEKLGERINALQQLVSPFGKTDTASVLSEAIGYIKFLQEQVQVLSSPYMKPTSTVTTKSLQDIGAEGASDLRSRGLCLVPVSCTMTVANNNNFNIGADYWASTPNFSSNMGSSATTTTRFSASS